LATTRQARPAPSLRFCAILALPDQYGLPVVAGGTGPYNPLDRVNLARSVEGALLDEPLSSLPPAEPFPGAGLYALYYLGDFPAYGPIVPPASEPGALPIYVGRAIPGGARAGVGGLLATTTELVLFQRLCQHAISLQRAGNLLLQDFRCRYLVVDDIWVPLAEALMISHYQPVWNQVLQGFGNHDPGGGRRAGARPDWDEVHPGRPWAARQAPARRSADESLARVAAHFASARSANGN
jgi:Eco29kI restriction endonuclease